jgi:hypothetical protein
MAVIDVDNGPDRSSDRYIGQQGVHLDEVVAHNSQADNGDAVKETAPEEKIYGPRWLGRLAERYPITFTVVVLGAALIGGTLIRDCYKSITRQKTTLAKLESTLSHPSTTPEIKRQKALQWMNDGDSDPPLELKIESEFKCRLFPYADMDQNELLNLYNTLKDIREIEPALTKALDGANVFLLPDSVRDYYPARTWENQIELFDTSRMSVSHELTHLAIQKLKDTRAYLERCNKILADHGYKFGEGLKPGDERTGGLSIEWEDSSKGIAPRPYGWNSVKYKEDDGPEQRYGTEFLPVVVDTLMSGSKWYVKDENAKQCALELIAESQKTFKLNPEFVDYARNSIEVATAPVPKIVEYEVQPGDMLGRLSSFFDNPIDEVMARNPRITDPNYIQAGWTLEFKYVTGSLYDKMSEKASKQKR